MPAAILNNWATLAGLLLVLYMQLSSGQTELCLFSEHCWHSYFYVSSQAVFSTIPFPYPHSTHRFQMALVQWRHPPSFSSDQASWHFCTSLFYSSYNTWHLCHLILSTYSFLLIINYLWDCLIHFSIHLYSALNIVGSQISEIIKIKLIKYNSESQLVKFLRNRLIWKQNPVNTDELFSGHNFKYRFTF